MASKVAPEPPDEGADFTEATIPDESPTEESKAPGPPARQAWGSEGQPAGPGTGGSDLSGRQLGAMGASLRNLGAQRKKQADELAKAFVNKGKRVEKASVYGVLIVVTFAMSSLGKSKPYSRSSLLLPSHPPHHSSVQP